MKIGCILFRIKVLSILENFSNGKGFLWDFIWEVFGIIFVIFRIIVFFKFNGWSSGRFFMNVIRYIVF